MNEEVKGRIGLDVSQYIASVQQVVKANNDIRKSVQQARETMEHAIKVKYEAKIKADNTQAIKKANEVRENIKKLQDNRAINIAAKDMTKDKFRQVKSSLNKLVGKPNQVVLKAIDKTKNTINSIKNNIFNLKTIAAGIVFGASAKFALDNTVGAGARLEQEEVSMKHFIGYQNRNKKGFDVDKSTQEYIEQLRHNANVTPFGTNEVISAGRRAVNIMQGDTKGGMDLVNLAENMASLNPGKTVMDAMEALADLKQGEAERMKEFGFKFSADDFVEASGAPKQRDKKGKEKKMKMSDLTDEQFNTAYGNIVKSKLNPFFEGGAEKLSKTAAGQWSTTTGLLQSMGSDMGKAFLPPINNILSKVNSKFEKLSSTQAFKNIKTQAEDFANKAGDKVLKIMDDLEQHPEKIKDGFENVKNVFKGIGDVLKTVGKLAKEAYKLTKPFLNFAGKNPKAALGVLAGLKFGPGMFKGLLKAPKNLKNLKKDLREFKTALGFLKKAKGLNIKPMKNIFKGIGKVSLKPFKLLKNAFKSIPKLSSKAFKGMTKGLKGITKTVPKIAKGISKGLGNAFKSIPKLSSKAFKGITKGLSSVVKTVPKIVSVMGKGLSSAFKVVSKVAGVMAKVVGKGLMGLFKVCSTVGKGIVTVIKAVTVAMMANPIIAIITAIIAVCVLLYQAWKHNWGGIRDKTQAVVDYMKPKIESIKETFEKVKEKCHEFAEAVKKKWGELKEFFSHPIKGTIELAKKGAAWVKDKLDGSQAAGISNVPYNGYLAELHEGERVLTAQENRSFKKGDGLVHISKLADNIIVREEADIDKITDALVRKLKKAQLNYA